MKVKELRWLRIALTMEYDRGVPAQAAEEICKLFADRDLAERFSKEGHLSSAKTYDPEGNGALLIDMYRTIASSAKEAAQ